MTKPFWKQSNDHVDHVNKQSDNPRSKKGIPPWILYGTAAIAASSLIPGADALPIRRESDVAISRDSTTLTPYAHVDWKHVNPANTHESQEPSKYLDIIVPHESTSQTSVSEVKASETPKPNDLQIAKKQDTTHSKENPSTATIDSFMELEAKYPGMLKKALNAMCREDPEFMGICQSISRKLQKQDGSQPSESSSERNSLNPGSDAQDLVSEDTEQRKDLHRSQRDHMEHFHRNMKKVTEASWDHLSGLRKRQDFSQNDFDQFLQKYYDPLVSNINSFESTTIGNFDAVNQNFDAVNQNFDNVNQNFDNVFSSLKNKINWSNWIAAGSVYVAGGSTLGIIWGLTNFPWRATRDRVMQPSLLVEDIGRMRRAAARRRNQNPANPQGEGVTGHSGQDGTHLEQLASDGQTLASSAAPMGRTSIDIGTAQTTREIV